jgi:hypothetical protein
MTSRRGSGNGREMPDAMDVELQWRLCSARKAAPWRRRSAVPEALVGLAMMSVCMEYAVPPCLVYCSAAVRIACSGDADPA